MQCIFIGRTSEMLVLENGTFLGYLMWNLHDENAVGCNMIALWGEETAFMLGLALSLMVNLNKRRAYNTRSRVLANKILSLDHFSGLTNNKFSLWILPFSFYTLSHFNRREDRGTWTSISSSLDCASWPFWFSNEHFMVHDSTATWWNKHIAVTHHVLFQIILAYWLLFLFGVSFLTSRVAPNFITHKVVTSNQSFHDDIDAA